jgi:transposase
VAMRVLVVAREQMTCKRTRAINALTALASTVEFGVDARTSLTSTQINTIASWRTRGESSPLQTCRAEAVRLASNIKALDSDLQGNRKSLDAAVKTTAAELSALKGVGAVLAASVLIALSRGGRGRSEAAFAALAGTCPIPASSGNTVRHRLNRDGDRRLNRALTTIVIVQMRTDSDTRATLPADEPRVARRRRSCDASNALRHQATLPNPLRNSPESRKRLTDIEASPVGSTLQDPGG